MQLLEARLVERISQRPGRPTSETIVDYYPRLKLFSEQDRMIVLLALRDGISQRQISAMLKAVPGTVSRRLNHVLQRLRDPVVRSLSTHSRELSPEQLAVGIEHFVNGLAVSSLARRHRRSRGEMQAIIDYVRGWHRGICARGEP